MEELRIGFYGLLLVNIVLGVLFGSFPLVGGFLMGNKKYALLGFVVCIAGGAILGVFLSFPVAMLFLWLILRNGSEEAPAVAQDTSTNADSDPDAI